MGNGSTKYGYEVIEEGGRRKEKGRAGTKLEYEVI